MMELVSHKVAWKRFQVALGLILISRYTYLKYLSGVALTGEGDLEDSPSYGTL